MPLMSSRRLLVVGAVLVLLGVLPALLSQLRPYATFGIDSQLSSLVVGLAPFLFVPLGSALVGAAAVVRHLEERVGTLPADEVSIDDGDAGARMAPRVWNPAP